MNTLQIENLLDFVGYHKKWHGDAQNFRKPYEYNQNDHLIEEIFKRLNITNGFFVEFGAWDGIKGSNTRKLFENGWKGVFIEPEPERFNKLEENYKSDPEVVTIKSFVELDGDLIFDKIVGPHVKRGIDFCSIDVDGLDLDIFETIEEHLPTVVCIEGGQMLSPLSQERLKKGISKHNIQQSLYIMNQSFERKGYKLLCTYQDSFFIKKEFYDQFNVSGSLMELYLDGILAYPRIPWILETIHARALKNPILEFMMSKLEYLPYNADSDQKSKWSSKSYFVLKEIVDKMKTINKR